MSQARELSAATIAFAVLTFLMTLPFSLSPASRVIADVPDTQLFLWTLAWDAHAFIHQPLHIFDANIYYPFANTLAYSENLIGSALVAAPIIWLTGNLVLAFNLTALLTCTLGATGAYFLARRLHLGIAAAVICGVIFAFGPPRLFRLGQLHMAAVQWMPFALAFLHSYFEGGKRRDLLLAIGCFSLQALASGHGAVYLAIAIAVLTLWQLATGMPLSPARRLRDVGAAGVYLAAPAAWIMLPYRLAQDQAGLRREFAPEVLPAVHNFLASPSQVDTFLRTQLIGAVEQAPDTYLFPGILVLLLAAIAVAGLIRRRPDNHAATFYLLLGTLATLTFVSWPFAIWEYVYWLPGFNFIRVPSRFVIVTLLALAVLGGIGFERLAANWPHRSRVIAAGVVCALLLVEFVSYPFPSVPYTVDVPAIDRWLDTLPKPFVVAELPVPSEGDRGALERQQTRSMLHATAHWQKTVHGYSGIRQPFHDQLYRDLNGFPNATSLTSLQEVGVTYVVVHTDDYGDAWPTIEDQIAKSGRLRLEHADEAGRVYSLLPQ